MALAPPRRQQHSSAQNNILVVNYVREARFCRAFLLPWRWAQFSAQLSAPDSSRSIR